MFPVELNLPFIILTMTWYFFSRRFFSFGIFNLYSVSRKYRCVTESNLIHIFLQIIYDVNVIA